MRVNTTEHGHGLPPEVTDLLRSVWSRATSGRAIPRAELREIACRVSAIARAEHLLPEQVILGVKESWRGFTGFRSADERDAQQALLTELISQCIRQFYRGEADGATPPDRDDSALRPRGADGRRQERAWEEVR